MFLQIVSTCTDQTVQCHIPQGSKLLTIIIIIIIISSSSKILKEEIYSKCQLCTQHEETKKPNIRIPHLDEE
jgi:hypothetical protein